MKLKAGIISTLTATILSLSFSSYAGWRDWIGDVLNDEKDTSSSSSSAPSQTTKAPLTNTTAISGLKQALEKGSEYAINELGKKNGFLDNADVRIPMPGQLRKVEKTLRSLGASRYADEFVTTMNHAAEKAVTEATPIFISAIKSMTIDDGLKILKGPDNAATEYFRGKTGPQLNEKMLPITRNMTDSSGVTSAYKKMIKKLGFASQYLNPEDVDLDQYVTQKTLDGLFLMLAREEKKIRSNPVARTTDLLKTVFGDQ